MEKGFPYLKAASVIMNDIDELILYAECALNHPPLPEGSHAFRAEKVSPPDIREWYSILYKFYAENKLYEPFREPVNAFEAGVFDYYTRISEPMSLRTVLDRMVEGKYKSTVEVQKDLALIWSNCQTYNGPTHPLAMQASTCGEALLKQLSQHDDSLPVPVDKLNEFRRFCENDASDELLEEIEQVVSQDAPDLLEDGALEISKIKRGLYSKLRVLMDRSSEKRHAGKRPRE